MADREFNVRISAETDDFSRGIDRAEREAREFGDALESQGKEQRLRFAGAGVKRYPMPKVRETQVRW